MFVMASQKKPGPFAHSDRFPEKRRIQFSIRMSDSENALIEQEAAKRGISALNLVRTLLAEGLSRPRKSRK